LLQNHKISERHCGRPWPLSRAPPAETCPLELSRPAS